MFRDLVRLISCGQKDRHMYKQICPEVIEELKPAYLATLTLRMKVSEGVITLTK